MLRRILLAILLHVLDVHAATAQLPAVEAAIAQVSLDSLVHTVRVLTGELSAVIGGTSQYIPSRRYTEPGNETAFQYLKERMTAYGLTVDTVCVGTRKSLVASLPGTLAKAWMLGAHYDNVGAPGQPSAGADDNASGAAAVLEAARILSASGLPLPYPVRFAFWDEEEIGFLGATDYQGYMDPDGLAGYINLDMIGYDGNGDSVAEVYTQPVAGSDALAALAVGMAGVYGIGLAPQTVSPAPLNSDYVPFWIEGHTAIGLAEDMDGDRNPEYHAPGDSLHLFNLPYFRKCTQWALATLLHSALDGPASIQGLKQEGGLTLALHRHHHAGVAIKADLPEAGVLSIGLYTAAGAEVLQWNSHVERGQAIISLTETELPRGVYFGRAIFRSTRGGVSATTLRAIF